MARRIEIIGFNGDLLEQNSTQIRSCMSDRSAEHVLDLRGYVISAIYTRKNRTRLT